MHQEIKLTREVSAIQIPSGDTLLVAAGHGGLHHAAAWAAPTRWPLPKGLARISAQDADALGVNPVEENKKQVAATKLQDAPLEEQVWNQLKGVYDPEIPVDIVNLGLVYDCGIEDIEGKIVVSVKMTLTAPGCGMGPVIAADAQAKIMTLEGIDDARVELVWDPAWNQEMISEEGKMKLGMI